MLRAVDVPQLHDRRNVILFSKQGSRPEADKMAGSDLDGDEFAVTWDPRLFLKTPNHEAFGFDDQALKNTPFVVPPSEDNERTQALIDHFFNHALSDILGFISMLWQDYAAANGAACDECQELAGLHSTAVDFPKTGSPPRYRNYYVSHETSLELIGERKKESLITIARKLLGDSMTKPSAASTRISRRKLIRH